MTNILSSISGYFSKSLILGTFLPVVIFIVLSTLFLVPLLPSDLSLFARLHALDKEWQVVAVSFITIVISGLVYNLNIPILRLFEGYPWRDSWIGSKLIHLHQNRFDRAEYQIEAMRVVLRRMDSASKDFLHSFVKTVIENRKALGFRFDSGVKEPEWLKIWERWPTRDQFSELRKQWKAMDADLDATYSAYRRFIKQNYPDGKALILPTRLGNLIRSFEHYSHHEYGIDSIIIWPRLIAVIPEDYAVSIDDAKTTFDFMMNCSALTLLLSFFILLAGLIYPAPLASRAGLVYWLIEITAFAAVSHVFYRLSINRAGAWGSLVKGSFDLYRWDLLKQLGHQQVPQGRQEERDLWEKISRQMIYGDPYNKRLLGYNDVQPSYPVVSSQPGRAKLEITRGITVDPESNVVTSHVRIKNTDPVLAEANIVVTDKLSADFDYEWGSAKIGDAEVPVSGTNPYEFTIGNLLRAQDAILTYKAIPRETSS